MGVDTLKVVEIFSSIEGEGIRSGLPCTFIRLYGCNLHCSYCDSRYACEDDEYREMSIKDIVKEVSLLGHPAVTLTGGEPLIHPYVYDLIDELIHSGFELNIETNGSVDLSTLKSKRNVFPDMDKLLITMDWKSLSSEMSSNMFEYNLEYLRNYDVLKFVVGSKEDLDQMKDIIRTYNPACNIFVSPIFGKIDPIKIVEYLLVYGLDHVRLQLQLHKIVWDPEERGV